MMSAFDYIIICSGFLGGLMVVWILFRLCGRGLKHFPIQGLSHRALLRRLEAKYPKESPSYASGGDQE